MIIFAKSAFKLPNTWSLTIYTPYSKGASATVDNIQQLCRKCNIKKRNKTANECFKCGGWLSHDAKHCYHCEIELPKVKKKNNLKSSGFFSELIEDLSDSEILFWLLRKGIAVLLLLYLVYYLYQSMRHK